MNEGQEPTETQQHSDESEDEHTVTYRKAALLIQSFKESQYMKRESVMKNGGASSYEDDFYADIVVRKNSIEEADNQQARINL
jgi:hypothetical protein